MKSKGGFAGWLRLAVAFGLLLLLSLSVPVLAQSEDQPGASPILTSDESIPALQPGEGLEPGISLPTEQDMAATADAIERARAEAQAALETPEAVRERESSRHAFENLSPAAAEALLTSRFADVLAALNNDPSRFLSDAELDRPLGETAAKVTSDGTTSLMEGVLPVRTEDDEGELSKVDLGLEKTNEGWVPANPLVEVAIDPSVEEGVEVGDEGLTITQAGAEDSTARPLGDKNIFFGEVEEGTDTDLLVSPTSAGVEMFDMLRSVDSPETLRFHVDVPQGGRLLPTPSGGAEVVAEDGSMLAEVPAPRAVDAQSQVVPVTLAVEGDALVLTVEHRKEDVAYPILVDPEVVDNWYYSFYNNQSLWTLGAWGYQESQNGWLNHGTSESTWPGHGGLFFASAPGNLPGGQWGQYLFSAPNSNSYFEKGTLVPFWRSNRSCSAPNPYPEPYDYDGMWYEGHWNESGVNLPDFNQANQLGYAELSWGQTVIFGVSTSNGISIPCWRDFGMMGLQLWLNDWDAPHIQWVTGLPTGWVKKGSNVTISAEAYDSGLGIQSMRIVSPEENATPWNQGWCAGTYENPCANSRSGQMTFSTEGKYEGEVKYSVQAFDPTGKGYNPVQETMKVDGTSPTITLSGQLANVTAEAGATENKNQSQGEDELSLPAYKLTVKAQDGKTGEPRSGVKAIRLYLDGATTPLAEQTRTCSTSNCELSWTYTLKLPGLEEGKHKLRIVAEDQVGNVTKPDRIIEFEYIPATGMKEEYVLQHIPLPDGHNYTGEEAHAPEIAVNVMNGNLVYHERDINVPTSSVPLELERFYNAQQPTEKDTQWGHGWTVAQAPELKPQVSESPPKATLTRTSAITSGVKIPTTQSQQTFNPKLHATVEKTPQGGYEVSYRTRDETAVFSSGGRIEENKFGVETEETGEAEAPPVTPTYTSSFGAVGSSTGQFKHPAGIAVDGSGNIWVVDENNYRVEKFNSAGTYQSSFGSQGTGDGQFGRPTDIAIDAAGNLWVTDAGNSRVEKFNSKGEFLAKYGSSGSGNGQFNAAESIAIDAKGNIWVGDTYNARLQKFNSNFEFVKAVGTRGSGTGQLIEPTGIDIGPGGNVWVADWGNNRVSVFNENGEFVRQFGSAGTGNGQFAQPDVIEVDSRGNVWVGDQNNGRIQEFNQAGEYVTQFGTKGTGTGQFSFGWPMGIASDSKGGLWIADTGNNRVQRWTVPNYTPTYTSSFGTAGTGNGQFAHPAGIAVGLDGSIWVVDENHYRVEKFNEAGTYQSSFGSQGTGDGQFGRPTDIAIDAAGNLWVTDAGNSRIEKFNSEGKFLAKYGSNGSGNGQFNAAESIAIDAKGNVWVGDTYNHRVQRLNENGEFVKAFGSYGTGSGQIVESTGIAVDSKGNVWVADWGNNKVLEFNENGEFIRQFGSSGSGNGQFSRPDVIEADSRGNIWVGDQNNSRIQEFNQSGEYVTQFGTAGSGNGQFSFGWPMGIASDSKGRLWISDTGNNRVQRFASQDSRVVQATPAVPPPAIDYSYSGSNLTKLKLEDPVTSNDPALTFTVTGGLTTNALVNGTNMVTYGYETGKLMTKEGPEGQTRYGYDSGGRLSYIKLPNGTEASITYDTTSRATKVVVQQPGQTAQTTNFFYGAEPRETRVWGGGKPEVVYSIGEDGSVFKWSYAEVEPAFDSVGGSFWASANSTTPVENKVQTLYAVASSPQEISSVQFLVDGSTVVAEKTCEDNAVPPDHSCEHVKLEWVTDPEAHPAGQLNIEMVITDFLGHSAAKRFFVTIPQVPPPSPEAATPPTYNATKQFREEFGLDLDIKGNEEAINQRILQLLYQWELQESVALSSAARWGVPLRPEDVAEMEYRERYIEQAATAIPQWAEAHAPSSYAGYYVDHRAGGIIRVGFTSNQTALVEQLKAEAGLMAPGRVEPFTYQPTRSLNGLKSLQQSAIEATTAPGSPPQIYQVDLDVEHNGVKAGTSEVAQTNQYMTQVFGAEGGVSAYFKASAAPEMSGRYRAGTPFMAGEQLQNTEKECTAGFGAWSKVGTKPNGEPAKKRYVLTAGHCFQLAPEPLDASQIVYRAHFKGDAHPVPIGNVERSGNRQDPNKFDTDAEAVVLDDPSIVPGWVYECCGGNASMKPTGVAYPAVGEVLCQSGLYSNGVYCGPVLGEASAGRLENKKHELSGWHWMLHIGAYGQPGDSGAPVWVRNTGKAVGLAIGGGNGLAIQPFIRPPNAPANEVAGVLSDPRMSPEQKPLHIQLGP